MTPIDANWRIQGLDGSLLPEGLNDTGAAAGADGSFKQILNGLVDEVDVLQKNADASIKGLVTGEETNVHNVAIKMEEASVAFDLMMEIRNKLLEAYQEISRMQA